ncbi:MAG: hypothetical protein RI897_1259 [Verrucomicrobiota bacterium]|jgi:hypothetical protein
MNSPHMNKPPHSSQHFHSRKAVFMRLSLSTLTALRLPLCACIHVQKKSNRTPATRENR